MKFYTNCMSFIPLETSLRSNIHVNFLPSIIHSGSEKFRCERDACTN